VAQVDDLSDPEPEPPPPPRRPPDVTKPRVEAYAPVPVDTALLPAPDLDELPELLADEEEVAGGVREIHARPAPFWRRVIAGTVDAALLALVLSGFLLAAGKVVGLKVPTADVGVVTAFVTRLFAVKALALPAAALTVLLCLVYSTAFGILGRTPGRMLAGLRLVDASGLSPGPVRAALRAVFSLFSFALFLCGFWLALFDRRGQTLHDKLTSTFVVRPL
jgi:uncharacterized RDD family membrane protein YckC